MLVDSGFRLLYNRNIRISTSHGPRGNHCWIYNFCTQARLLGSIFFRLYLHIIVFVCTSLFNPSCIPENSSQSQPWSHPVMKSACPTISSSTYRDRIERNLHEVKSTSLTALDYRTSLSLSLDVTSVLNYAENLARVV